MPKGSQSAPGTLIGVGSAYANFREPLTHELPRNRILGSPMLGMLRSVGHDGTLQKPHGSKLFVGSFSFSEVGFSEVGFSEVDFSKVDFSEVGSVEVGSLEVGS
jgi:hypothetical protein